MKKISKYFLWSAALLFLVIACTKELTDDLIASFNVEFSDVSLEAFVSIPEASDFTITGGSSSAEDYSFRYSITEGSGSYSLDNQMIAEEEFIKLSSLTNTLSYIGTEIGVHKVTITIRDNIGRQEDYEVTYDVQDTDFEVIITPSPQSAYIGGFIDLNIEIVGPEVADYDLQYVFNKLDGDSSGAAQISLAQEVLEPETVQDINGNEAIWQLEGTELGVVEITFTATSSFGIPKEETIRINVTETPDFSFIAMTDVEELPTNIAAEVNFELTELVGNSNYSMTYSTTSTGILIYQEIEYQPGDEIPVEIGETLGVYTGTSMGVHDIEFTVTNANTLAIEKTSIINLLYTDPDIEAPVIELLGDPEIVLSVGEEFDDPGATATDNIDETVAIEITGELDISQPGVYILTYTATDSSDNTASVTRTITVQDNEAPSIELIEDERITVLLGTSFDDPGVILSDNVDSEEELRGNLIIDSNVNTATEGLYIVTYTVTDSSGNETSVDREVNVVNDAPPVITILGENPIEFNAMATYQDSGAEVTDDIDQNLTVEIVENNVDSDRPGTYRVLYRVRDSGGNEVEEARTVVVFDNEDPVIRLANSGPISHRVNTPFTNPTPVITDNASTAITSDVNGVVNVARLGENRITYTATDASNNTATKELIVNVIDDIAPVIRLSGFASISVLAGDTFVDPGATASDNFDGNITSSIVTGGTFRNTQTPGNYTITYDVRDSSGNLATRLTRTIIVNSITSFNPDTGVLKARPGASITISVSTPRTAPGRGARSTTEVFNIGNLIPRLETCWGTVNSSAFICGPGSSTEDSFTFVMPNADVLIESRHQADGSTAQANSFTIIRIEESNNIFEVRLNAGRPIIPR